MREENKYNQNEDMIDLKEILLKIYQEKLSLFLAVFLWLSVGLSYLYIKTPEYQTKAKITANHSRHYEILNQYELTKFNSNEIFQRLYFLSESHNHLKVFFETNKTDKKDLESFKKALSIEMITNKALQSKEDRIQAIEISYKYLKGEKGPQLLDAYLLSLNTALKKEVLKEFLEVKQARAKELKLAKDLLYFELKEKKENELALLEEAYSLALALNITDFTLASTTLDKNEKSSFLFDLSQEKKPLYLLGTKALKAQIKSLKNREKLSIVDDRAIKIEKELLKLAQIDKGFDDKKLM